jgi:hypothetical protein
VRPGELPCGAESVREDGFTCSTVIGCGGHGHGTVQKGVAQSLRADSTGSIANSVEHSVIGTLGLALAAPPDRGRVAAVVTGHSQFRLCHGTAAVTAAAVSS